MSLPCYKTCYIVKECPYRVEGFYKMTEEEYNNLQYEIEQVRQLDMLAQTKE